MVSNPIIAEQEYIAYSPQDWDESQFSQEPPTRGVTPSRLECRHAQTVSDFSAMQAPFAVVHAGSASHADGGHRGPQDTQSG